MTGCWRRGVALMETLHGGMEVDKRGTNWEMGVAVLEVVGNGK